MKILLLEQFSELGGGQQCLLDLLPALRDRGWSATLAAPGSGPLFAAARAAGAETVPIELGPYANGRKTAGDAARFAIDTVRLGNWIARQDADLLYLSGPRPLPAAAWGARGRPVIFHAQHFLGKRYAVTLAAWALHRARATVIADAECVGAQFAGLISPDRMRVVYNGVAEIPFRARTHARTLKIGIVGRIAPMKGQTDFLRAAAQLINSGLINSEHPGMTFIVCGAPMFCPEAYSAEVQRLAQGLPVDFLGWRDDVGAVLNGLDLLVVPSTAAEATTRVILEAFSAGVPVIAYAIGGIPEIVRDGDTGFLVPECEPVALARKIRDVARMNLEPIALRARADWERRFTLPRYRREMTDAIAAAAPPVMRARGTTSGRLRSASE